MVNYVTNGEKHTVIFDESRHIQSDILSLVYVQLFGILGYVSNSETLGILFLGSIILILQLVMMRVENPKPWRHLYSIYMREDYQDLEYLMHITLTLKQLKKYS